MAHAEAFTCDVCGKSKGETNHWLLLLAPVDPGFDCAEVFTRFAVAGWNALVAQEPGVRHLCGSGCAAVALDRTLNPQPAAPEAE